MQKISVLFCSSNVSFFLDTISNNLVEIYNVPSMTHPMMLKSLGVLSKYGKRFLFSTKHLSLLYCTQRLATLILI
jgi:hypothetical protein